MVYVVSNEKKNYIVDTYGTTLCTVIKIIKIVNSLDLPFFDDEDFIVTIESIVSKLQTEMFQRQLKIISANRACYTISSAILTTLNEKFSDDYLYDESITKKILILE